MVCRTYGELAEALAERGILAGKKDPIRQIQKWAKEKGFPGRPATTGKRDGHFPVDAIEQWCRERSLGGAKKSERLQELELQLAEITVENKLREQLELAGRLCDVDEVAAVNRQCIANCKAVIDALPDELLALLPAKEPSGEEWTLLRSEFHQRVSSRIKSAYDQMKAIWESEESEEEGETD